LRIVLLGDSKDLLPPTLYANHILEEDLNQQNLGLEDLEQYFRVFRESRVRDLDSARIKTLAAESLKRAKEIQASNGLIPESLELATESIQRAKEIQDRDTLIPWPQALAIAVQEKSASLEALVAQKGGTNGS